MLMRKIGSATLSLPKGTCDIIKLLSALLVMTSHMGSVALGPAYGSTNPAFYAMATQSGYTGVAIFFFLSGFGLMESESRAHLGVGQFFRRRFWKVYFPVLLVSLLWLPFTPPTDTMSLIHSALLGGVIR